MRRDDGRRLIKELGLDATYRLLAFTTQSEHLHYGRFEPDIPPTFANLKAAQDRYLQRLLELIPDGVRTILDVGCGTGKTAQVLLDAGYSVECVAPPSPLLEKAMARLGNRVRFHRGRFEELAIEGSFDLVLFSESFQYIPPRAAIERSLALLAPGGHLLIADFFRRDPHRASFIRGGHALADWERILAEAPVDILVEQDITEETAPVHDINLAFNREVVAPLMAMGGTAARVRWPFLSRIAGWVFRREIAKLDRRFGPDRTGSEFKLAKIYKVYLLRKAIPAPVVVTQPAIPLTGMVSGVPAVTA
jgi:SAM-dependent methyltransferase